MRKSRESVSQAQEMIGARFLKLSVFSRCKGYEEGGLGGE